jgi:serine/threonine protein kinase/formylglycine-generating enzyme required for sulfatase activity
MDSTDHSAESSVPVDSGDLGKTLPADAPSSGYEPIRPEPGFGEVSIQEHVFCRYRNFKLIASGGGGIVESCVDPSLGRRVAVKMLQPKLREDSRQRRRFLREARIMAQVEHPNIMPVHELGECGEGNIYYAMKYIQGISLNDVLNGLSAGNPAMEAEFSERRLIDIFEHVCQAVAFAHSRGVIHRDLKPENIMIGDFGEVLVMDWGLAKVIHGEEDTFAENEKADWKAVDETTLNLSEKITLDGAIAGTPAYMAPEQAAGNISELDERTDVYALGAILYEILTLERTVAGESVREVMEQVLNAEIPDPREVAPNREVPRELAAVCMKALCKSPEDRYAGVSELMKDLHAFQRGFGVSCLEESLPRRFWKMCLRHRTVSLVVALAITTAALVYGGVELSRASRVQALQQTAFSHFERGTVLYRRLIRLASVLKAVRENRAARQASVRERRLEKEYEALLSQGETEYKTAMILFHQAGIDPFSHAFSTCVEQIYLDRLRLARVLQDTEHGQRLLSYVRSKAGADFEGVCPQKREDFARFASWVEGFAELSVTLHGRVLPGRLHRVEKNVSGQPWSVAGDFTRLEFPVVSRTVKGGILLIEFSLTGGDLICVPVFIRAGEKIELDIFIPERVPAGMVYVAEGPFWKGGMDSPTEHVHRAYTKGFFMDRKEVSIGEYRRYWLDPDGGAGRLGFMPRTYDREHPMCPRDLWDADGNMLVNLSDDSPVFGVSHRAAQDFCRWRSEKTGMRFRLPSETEWEKAARGVDGRRFVWGDAELADAAFSMANTVALERFGSCAPGGSFLLDRSVYGAFDMAGNVREWTATESSAGSGQYLVKGGSSLTPVRFLPCAHADDAVLMPADVGFRCVVSVE